MNVKCSLRRNDTRGSGKKLPELDEEEETVPKLHLQKCR